MVNLSFSIVCCYYNEKKLLKLKFDELILKSKKLPFSHEIIICDNNSTDGTTELLKEYEKQNIPNFKFIFNDNNLGKGGSIKKAISNSINEYIIIYDLDEYLLEDLITANEILDKNRSIDYLIGNRISSGTKFIYKKNLYGVIALTKLTNFLYKLNLTDIACATKIFRRSIYNKFTYKKNHFDFEFEVMCKFAKIKSKFQEYTVEYHPRSFDDGKKLRAFKDGPMILATIILNYF